MRESAGQVKRRTGSFSQTCFQRGANAVFCLAWFIAFTFAATFAFGENSPTAPIVNAGGIDCAAAESGKVSPCKVAPTTPALAPTSVQNLDKEDFDRLSRDVYQRLREDVDRAEGLSIDRSERAQRRVEFVIYVGTLLFLLIAAFAVYMGLGKLDLIKSESKSELIPMLKDVVEIVLPEYVQPLRTKIDNLEKKRRFDGLYTLVTKVNEGTSFTRTDRDAAMTELEEFHEEIRSGAMGDSGTKAVVGLLDSMFKAGNWPQLRKLESLFPEMLQNDSDARNTMLQAYLNLVFSPAAMPGDVDRAKAYSQAAWAAKFGETALPEDLAYIYHSENDPDR